MRRLWLVLPLLALCGCKAMLPGVEDCAAPRPFDSAREVPPLRVPDGLDLPNTRNALRIPEVAAPERPPSDRCLDYPPRFRNPS